MKLVPKNWSSFQHYRDRAPPWVKLHKGLLDDRQYQRLPIASRALAPMLWLLASESKDGEFDASIDELRFRLRAEEADVVAGLKPLIDAGFFLLTTQVDTLPSADCKQAANESQALSQQPACIVLADCLQLAVPEERREETETKKEEKPRKTRLVSPDITLSKYLEDCKAANIKPVPDDHPIRAYCEDAGISPEMLQVAWITFRDSYTTGDSASKNYKDWPAAFGNAVRRNYFKLWHVTPEGATDWTSSGMQQRKVAAARASAREAKTEATHAA